MTLNQQNAVHANTDFGSGFPHAGGSCARDAAQLVEQLNPDEMRSVSGGQIPANGWVRFAQFWKEVFTFGQADTDFG